MMKILLRESNEFKILLYENQEEYLSSFSKIEKLIEDPKNIAYDIFENDNLIGFALLNEFEKGKFFLWDFAIDYRFQNLGIGTAALKELIEHLISNFKANLITTTCKAENHVAINFFKKFGFKVTDYVNMEQIHELNLIMHF